MHQKIKQILAVSGDRHRSGIYQNEHFVEITASSLNKSASKNDRNGSLCYWEKHILQKILGLWILSQTRKKSLSLFMIKMDLS
jgi:hypothetical protein